MISAELFCRTETRAKQVKRNDEEEWGGLSVIASGDFAQLPPVNQTSLAAIMQQRDELSVAATLRWQEENSEALQGRSLWCKFNSCIILSYSRRCHGLLHDILQEMLIPGGALSDHSWTSLQGRVLGFNWDEATQRVRSIPGNLPDERMAQAQYTNSKSVVGVLRHSIRVIKVMDAAVLQARLAGQRLLLSISADRADASARRLQVPVHLYHRFVACPNLCTTKNLSGVLPLCRGLEVALEEKCVSNLE